MTGKTCARARQVRSNLPGSHLSSQAAQPARGKKDGARGGTSPAASRGTAQRVCSRTVWQIHSWTWQEMLWPHKTVWEAPGAGVPPSPSRAGSTGRQAPDSPRS